MIKFSEWLIRRKKAPTVAIKEPAQPTSHSQFHMSPDEIDALWKRTSGEPQELTPEEKARLPLHHMSPDELRAAWERSSGGNQGLTPEEKAKLKARLPLHHMSPDEINALFSNLKQTH